MTEVEAFASGKHIGLFGSYGWGMEVDARLAGPYKPCRRPRESGGEASLPGRAGRRCTQSVQGSWEKLWRPQKHNVRIIIADS